MSRDQYYGMPSGECINLSNARYFEQIVGFVRVWWNSPRNAADFDDFVDAGTLMADMCAFLDQSQDITIDGVINIEPIVITEITEPIVIEGIINPIIIEPEDYDRDRFIKNQFLEGVANLLSDEINYQKAVMKRTPEGANSAVVENVYDIAVAAADKYEAENP
jgi:hypothetical protein